MAATKVTDRTLLRLHLEAVWGVQLSSIDKDVEDVELLPESAQASWHVCVADVASGRVYIWGQDVPEGEREPLRARIDAALREPTLETPSQLELHREIALSLDAPPRLDAQDARRLARPLTAEDRLLLAAYDPDDPDYFLHPPRQPLIGVVIAGQLLSIAHSSRRTSEACELGLETAPQARRKGYALAATCLWTQEVLQEGLVPLYSANATNIASLRTADAAGYRAFARVATFNLP